MPEALPPAPHPGALRSFLQLLQVAEDGRLVADLSDATSELSRKLREVELNGGKPKARLSLVLEVRLDRGLVEVEADFSMKLPKTRRGRTLLHVLPDGTLSTSDPRQPQLPLRDATRVTDVRAV